MQLPFADIIVQTSSTSGVSRLHGEERDLMPYSRDMSHIFRSLWDNPLFRASFVKSRQ